MSIVRFLIDAAATGERPTLSGGAEVVLATDLVVASRTAKFGIPEVKRGLVAAGGGLLRLPHRIPYQKALELALTGDNFTAEQGEAWGFVNVLTEPGEGLAGRQRRFLHQGRRTDPTTLTGK